jgi:DNA-3-methyladenine glycosylase II
MTPRLTEGELARAVTALCQQDPDLARVVSRFGPPPLWQRDPGFATLVQIILEQQVSLASARAAYARLVSVASGASAGHINALDERALAAAGLTRQKSGYVRALARAVVTGEFAVERLSGLDDEGAHAELVKLRGIGPWSADIYLLMALGRPDVWPRQDLALAIAMREVKRLRAQPGPDRQLEISDSWRPWRAVAARILWHHYLSTPRRQRARRPGPVHRMSRLVRARP